MPGGGEIVQHTLCHCEGAEGDRGNLMAESAITTCYAIATPSAKARDDGELTLCPTGAH